MSGHEVMVQRITAIIVELYQYGFVSRKKMMDEFNISERTLYRDLNRLGDRIVPDGDGIYRLAPAYAKPQALKEQQNLGHVYYGDQRLVFTARTGARCRITLVCHRFRLRYSGDYWHAATRRQFCV
ncbi:TPA: DeoR family transcriptional regulator [Escherichia coli]|nr:DeoR family transcriptional regulator [Escherichia coli]